MPGTSLERFQFANSSYEDSKFVIFGVPYDMTCTFMKGTRYGPSGIREATATFEPNMFEYGIDLTEINIHDAGDLEVDHDTPDEMVRHVREFSKKLVSDGKFPIMLGGEHSVSPGCATAFDDIDVLGIDAHIDYYDVYESEKNSHACAMKRIVDKFGENRVLWVGVRSIGKPEVGGAHRALDSLTIHKKGIDWTISEIERLLTNDKMYISLDIDGIDPAYAPGTGTPVPFGLNPIDVKQIIDRFAPRLVGFDLVEVSPPLDNGITANLAAMLILEVITVRHLADIKKSS